MRRVRVLQVVVSFKYQLLGDAWNTLVDDLGLEPGITVVFTKSPGHRLWVDAFNDDGSMITEFVFKGTTTLRRVQLPLEWHEESMRYIIPFIAFMCSCSLTNLPKNPNLLAH